MRKTFLSILAISLLFLIFTSFGEEFNLKDYNNDKIDSILVKNMMECSVKNMSTNEVDKFCQLIKRSTKVKNGNNLKEFGYSPYSISIYFKNKTIDEIFIANNNKNEAKMLCNPGMFNDYYYFNFELYTFISSNLKCN